MVSVRWGNLRVGKSKVEKAEKMTMGKWRQRIDFKVGKDKTSLQI